MSLKSRILSLLATLPPIAVGLDDWHLHVNIYYKRAERSVGVTIGPRFMSLDRDGDIAYMVVSPPEGYQPPLSDICFSWDSREGLSHLNVPAVHISRQLRGWTSIGVDTPQGPTSEAEEDMPPTQRWPKGARVG